MSFEIVTICNGPFKQNCYLVIADNGEALVIDPGSESDRIHAELLIADARPLAIVNTHAHFDHVGAVDAISRIYDIPFYLHSDDVRLLSQANLYVKIFGGKQPIKVPRETKDLAEKGSPYVLGEFRVDVIDTPGHTVGSVCIKLGGNVFVGDTILAGGPGRTDLPGGSRDDLEASVARLQSALPPDSLLWPGHGRTFRLEEMNTKKEDA